MNRILAAAVLLLAALIGNNPEASAEVGISVVFSDKEIAIIGSWYEDHRHSHGKPGRKAKGLPPGIAKNLARGKPLPPGIAKQHLPAGLRELLPPPPHGYERIIVDGKILLVEIATRVVHDVLADIILK